MSETKFEAFGLVELFGHQRVVGKISEQSIGGCNFVRVDIPQKDGTFYTRFFGNGAIYAINITTEEVAMQLAARMDQEPAFAWQLPKNPQLADATRASTSPSYEDDEIPL